MYIKTVKKTAIAITLSSSMVFSAMAEVVLVVHPSNDASLNKKTVQRIFLGKSKKFSNGKEAKPINQVASSEIRKSFDSDTLGRSSSQVSAYWSKLVFTGKGIPPKEVDNDAAVIAEVSSNPNAVGYVENGSVDDSVKTIPLN